MRSQPVIKHSAEAEATGIDFAATLHSNGEGGRSSWVCGDS